MVGISITSPHYSEVSPTNSYVPWTQQTVLIHPRFSFVVFSHVVSFSQIISVVSFVVLVVEPSGSTGQGFRVPHCTTRVYRGHARHSTGYRSLGVLFLSRRKYRSSFTRLRGKGPSFINTSSVCHHRTGGRTLRDGLINLLTDSKSPTIPERQTEWVVSTCPCEDQIPSDRVSCLWLSGERHISGDKGRSDRWDILQVPE